MLYTQHIIEGKNIPGTELRAQTIMEYLDAVNALFVDRGFEPVADLRDSRNCKCCKLYDMVKTWENEPRRRSYLTHEFMVELFARAGSDATGLGFTRAMLDWTLLGRYTGIRLAEYGQPSQTKIDYHCLPNGRKIVKAFRRGDFLFFDKAGRLVDPTDPTKHDSIHEIKITWRVQKNRRNGQTITWARDHENAQYCPVLAARRIYCRSIRLQLQEGEPMGAYLEKGKRKYITGTKISALFQSIARAVYPGMPNAEIKKFSAHSLRVTSAVLLQMAEANDDYIKIRLRWEGDSYKKYLRDNSVLAYQHLRNHATALAASYALAPTHLFGPLTASTPQLSQAEMGSYTDI